jgi:oligopeptidase B
VTTKPPIAKRVDSIRSFHGDDVNDEYAWMADLDDPDTTAYLEAENAYTQERVAHLEPLRESLFQEMKARTQETDLSLPNRKGGYWYYTRTVEGLQYGIHCRVPLTGDEPPRTEGGKPLDGEEILLDGNEIAEGHDFFSLGTFDVSPDGQWLAYSTDYLGNERFTLRIKNLATGETLPDQVDEVAHGSAWSLDASVIFYATVDDAWRSDKAWRHVVGTPSSEDVMIYHEPDAEFDVVFGLTRSERFLIVGSSATLTTEYWFVPADAPLSAPVVIAPRRHGVDYSVEHHGHRFLITHNDQAEDFAIAYTSVDDPGEWTPLVEHQPGTRILGVDAFAGHLVVSLRKDGLSGLRVMPLQGGGDYDVTFPEPIYTVDVATNLEFDTPTFRLSYSSLVTPDSIYDCDFATGNLTLRKQRPVLPDPSGAPFDPSEYEQVRDWALADDGARVPLSIVRRRDTPADGSAPTLLYGYGSYEHSIDPQFSIARLSLLDRGVIFAIAHVRGGGEMGRQWYLNGKLTSKKNTFTDFIACARHVVSSGLTNRVVAHGRSAGGLLMGAIANMAPDAFAGIAAGVPFVDALTTILDPSLPLTAGEWDEWGNPIKSAEIYEYMKSYSPYENVASRDYPPILAYTTLHDTRVRYVEPAKWVAKIRAAAPDADVLLKCEMGGGHAGPSGRYDAWKDDAFINAWILDKLGKS